MTEFQAGVAPTSPTPPGWYPDPHQPGWLRWFDGTQWTAHAAPYQTTSQVPAELNPWTGLPQRDRTQEYLLPVNRTGWSIAAGYLGLFSILLIFAPIALIVGVVALIDLSHKPDVGGRGRAWFGLVAGALGTLGLFAVL